MIENNILNEISNRVNKLKVALRELRESEVWLKIIVKAKLIQPATKLSPLLQETDELISILFKSIDTAKKKNER
ncbi:four helix bundle protein [bacterium]|nr:MAG: four helix bundle protein [bacterium]